MLSADARTQKELTPEQKKFFNDKGFLLIKNAVGPEELQRLQVRSSSSSPLFFLLPLPSGRNRRADRPRP